jgi:hypothetical protein
VRFVGDSSCTAVSKRVAATQSVVLVRAMYQSIACECLLVRTHCEVPCREVQGKAMERGEKINVLSSIFALDSVSHPILLPWSVEHLVVRECSYSLSLSLSLSLTHTHTHTHTHTTEHSCTTVEYGINNGYIRSL